MVLGGSFLEAEMECKELEEEMDDGMRRMRARLARSKGLEEMREMAAGWSSQAERGDS